MLIAHVVRPPAGCAVCRRLIRGVSVLVENKGQIGPHEEKEFDLFREGEKDLIFFAYDWQPENHQQIAKKLGAEQLLFEDPDTNLPNYIYYRKGFLDNAEELRDIILSDMRMADSDWAEKEHRIGELLGYSREDVEMYINKFVKHHAKKH